MVMTSIYIVYNDGSYSPFNDNASKEGVHGIGVVYDGHSFQVALEDLGVRPLIEKGNNSSPDESPFYKTECEGLHDWDFVSATNHLRECGMDIPIPAGWHIPTLAVLEVMCFMKEEINKALVFAGGKPMPNDYHWSSTESSRSNARFVNFYSVHASSSGKDNSNVVRHVAAFN